MKIEIDSIEELKDFLAMFTGARPVEAVREETAEPEVKVRKTRAKVEPEVKPEPAEEPEMTTEQAQAYQKTEDEFRADDAKKAAGEAPKAEDKPKGKSKKVTRDDVVAAFRGYIDRFGQKAAMTDVTVLLKRGFDVSMIKEIPDGEENFKKAIKIVTEAININEFNREAVQ